MSRGSSTAARVAAALLCAALLAAPGRAQADSLAYEGAIGIGAALCSLIWGPLKVVYAVSGMAVSTLALLWTADTGIAGKIFSQTVGGDYVVTPSHLEGERDLHFFGPTR